MRRCRASTASLAGAALGYLVAATVHLGWLLPPGNPHALMIAKGCELVGNVLLLLSMGLHARYVILDAQGLLPVKPARSAKEKAKPASDSKEKKPSDAGPAAVPASAKRNDLEPVSRPAAVSLSRSAPVADDDYDDDEDELDERTPRKARTRQRLDDEEPIRGDHKLNRADRKALRRHKEQQRRAG
jgi:hypothetical protein